MYEFDSGANLTDLKCGLKDTVGHTVSVAMAITVVRVVVFVGKEHHVDLNTSHSITPIKSISKNSLIQSSSV